MLEINILSLLIAFLPLLVLLVSMLALKWSAPKAGTVAWIVAGFGAWVFFGADGSLLIVACAKGLSLSLFVLLIIWSSVFLYNFLKSLSAIEVIGMSMIKLVSPRLGQILLLSWVFSGFVQGIAGFGVPVAVVAPLVLMLGFSPVTAAASVLVGHSWSVTFGSMGSSYYTIQLVTGIPGEIIGPAMAILFSIPIIATGFAVAHIEGGWQSVRKGALAIIIVGVIVSSFVWLMTYLNAAQIASVVPGLIGCGLVWLLSKTSLFGYQNKGEMITNAKTPIHGLNVHLAFLPYYFLITLTSISQLQPLKELGKQLYFGINYPRLETSLGYITEAANAYAKISLINHPAPLIIISTFLTYLVFKRLGHWENGVTVTAFKTTVKQCTPTSLGIATMVMMALIMTNTGMTEIIANGIARVTGAAFPIFSPYIGVLGSFMTGSNTNSNVMFGALQTETAKSLGINPTIIASAQSIGGSLGSAIAPAKVLIGSTLVGLVGREAEVMRKAMPYCLIIVLIAGLETLIAINIFK